MNKSQALGVIFIGLAVFLGTELIRSPRPVSTVNTGATNTATTNLYARAAISGAVMRVRADIASATNTNDAAALRLIEHTLTNILK